VFNQRLGSHLAVNLSMVCEAARRWGAQKYLQLSLLAELGPRTVVAYGRIVHTIVAERLWTVPPRRWRPGMAHALPVSEGRMG
jgi:hypothetical protein